MLVPGAVADMLDAFAVMRSQNSKTDSSERRVTVEVEEE
jgi:sarcosine oxidase gamma subunit